MKIIAILTIVFSIAAAEFLTSIESQTRFSNASYSITLDTQGNFAMVAATNQTFYQSFLMKLSPSGQMLTYSYYTFNPTAGQLIAQSNNASYILPATYDSTTAILRLSSTLDPMQGILFNRKIFPRAITQVTGSDEYLLVGNNILIKFSTSSKIYKAYEFKSFKARNVKFTSDRNFIVTGEIYNRNPSSSYYYYKTVVAKLDQQLNKIWVRYWQTRYKIYCILQTIDGGFLLGGKTLGSRQESAIITRIDSSGYKQFGYHLSPYGDTFHIEAMTGTKDSQILVTGSYDNKLYVIRISDQGSILFARVITTSFPITGLSIIEAENKIVISGFMVVSEKREIFILELDHQGMTNNPSYPIVNFTIHSSTDSYQLKQGSYYEYQYSSKSTLIYDEIGNFITVTDNSGINQSYFFHDETEEIQTNQKQDNSIDQEQKEQQEQEEKKDKEDEKEEGDIGSSPQIESKSKKLSRTQILLIVLISLLIIVWILLCVILIKTKGCQNYNIFNKCKERRNIQKDDQETKIDSKQTHKRKYWQIQEKHSSIQQINQDSVKSGSQRHEPYREEDSVINLEKINHASHLQKLQASIGTLYNEGRVNDQTYNTQSLRQPHKS